MNYLRVHVLYCIHVLLLCVQEEVPKPKTAAVSKKPTDSLFGDLGGEEDDDIFSAPRGR